MRCATDAADEPWARRASWTITWATCWARPTTRCYKDFDAHVRAAGLSSIEWRVLAALHDSPPLDGEPAGAGGAVQAAHGDQARAAHGRAGLGGVAGRCQRPALHPGGGHASPASAWSSRWSTRPGSTRRACCERWAPRKSWRCEKLLEKLDAARMTAPARPRRRWENAAGSQRRDNRRRPSMNEVKWTGGIEHWIRKGDIKLFLWHKKASPRVPHAGTVFFVHGSSMASQPTFDLHVPGRPYSSAMDWFSRAGLRHLDHGQRRLRALRQAPRHQLRHQQRRRRPGGGHRVRPEPDRRRQAADVRHFLGRTEGRAVHRAASRTGGQARARRVRLDRRGQPDAGAAQEEAAGVPGQEPPPDRPRLRAQHLPARPSRHGRRSHRQRLRRRHPVAGRLDADRHLRRHVLQAAAAGSEARSPCRPSSCAASTTASPAWTT